MNDISLIPEQRQIKKRCKLRKRLWVKISSTYVVILILALSGIHAVYKVDNAAVAQDLESKTVRNRHYNNSILRLRKELARISMILQTSRAIKQQPDWSKLLFFLSDAMGQDIVLSQCSVSILDESGREIVAKDRSLTSQEVNKLLRIRQYRMSLYGRGVTQSAVSMFAVRLEQSGLFGSVSIISNQRQSFLDQSAISFVIECRMQ